MDSLPSSSSARLMTPGTPIQRDDFLSFAITFALSCRYALCFSYTGSDARVVALVRYKRFV